MTMPARRASKFSAKWRAMKLQTIFQSLNSQTIPGCCEAWSECQPEFITLELIPAYATLDPSG